jgi:ABC-2 type transport system ATP-binding protein
MVVQEYLQMIANLREIPEEQQKQLISAAVVRTGLEKHLVRPIGELSKGYRQRVGLAQAILHQPRVLILDEPTSGLDPNQIIEIRALIKELSKEATVLLSTHILSEVELTCERVLIINRGEVHADAQIDELRATNAAVVAVEGPEQAVTDALRELSDVEGVKRTGGQNGFVTYRIMGGGEDLCPRVYDLIKDNGWRLAELRPDQQNLETVFRDIVEHGVQRAGEAS